jgi:hypothetical protein
VPGSGKVGFEALRSLAGDLGEEAHHRPVSGKGWRGVIKGPPSGSGREQPWVERNAKTHTQNIRAKKNPCSVKVPASEGYFLGVLKTKVGEGYCRSVLILHFFGQKPDFEK